MTCFSDCSYLDLNTCQPRISPAQPLDHLDYDEDGCYDPAKYLELVNHQNFQAYSTFIGSVMLGLGALGIVGNLLSIVVLLNKERVCFNYILVALNISDSLHIVFAVLDVVRNNHQESYPHFLLSTFPYFHYPLYRLTLSCSIFLVVAVSCERYLSLTRPMFRIVTTPAMRSLCYILPAILLAILLNLPRFLETQIDTHCMDFTSCGCGYHEIHFARPTQLRLSKDYIFWYSTLTWAATTSLLPFLLLASLNYVIWIKLKEGRRRLVECSTDYTLKGMLPDLQTTVRERRLCLSSTSILICTVSMFLVTNLPRLCLSLYEAVMINSILKCQTKHKGITPIWFIYVMASVQLLQVVNTSINFPIYWFVGSFRETFFKIFCRNFKTTNNSELTNTNTESSNLEEVIQYS